MHCNNTSLCSNFYCKIRSQTLSVNIFRYSAHNNSTQIRFNNFFINGCKCVLALLAHLGEEIICKKRHLQDQGGKDDCAYFVNFEVTELYVKLRSILSFGNIASRQRGI